jgi:hypothetical protein
MHWKSKNKLSIHAHEHDPWRYCKLTNDAFQFNRVDCVAVVEHHRPHLSRHLKEKCVFHILDKIRLNGNM